MENGAYDFFPDDLFEKHTKHWAGILFTTILFSDSLRFSNSETLKPHFSLGVLFGYLWIWIICLTFWIMLAFYICVIVFHYIERTNIDSK